MRLRHAAALAAVASVLLAAGSMRAATADQAFANGETLLAKADFQGAMQAFAAAARADRANQEYLQHYAMVQQVIAMRSSLAAEKSPERWEYTARGLHSFYISQGLYQEALALDEQMHARLNTTISATLLAETQLAMNLNAEAATTLSGLEPSKQTAATRALAGLALARQGKLADARQVAGGLQLASEASPGELYSTARLHAAVGNQQEALQLLTRCFESLTPSSLDALKDHARQTPDFASLASTEAFTRVLKTESKVPESKCSGGSGCAGCPMRGSCPSSQGH
jgi:hypothetical protein